MPAGNRGPRSYRALLALAAVGCAALLGAGSPAAQAGGPSTTLSNAVVHNLSLATLTGSVPATQTMTVGVFLSNPNQAAEDAYAKQLYDPSSPNYGNYLDPDTFNSQFGVPAANTQAAETWLQGAGLTVTPIESSTQYVLASGSAAQVEAAFGTPLNTYTAAGRDFYANTAAPTVPASLGISDVFGLNNFNRLHIPRVQATGATTTSAVPTSGNVPKTGLLSIKDLWSIYDAPSTNLGNGQTMAIFGWGVTDPVISAPPPPSGRRGRPHGAAPSRDRVGPPGSPDQCQEVRRHVDARHERGRRHHRVGARHAGVDGHGAQRQVRDPLLRAPQHRCRHPRFDGRLGQRQAGPVAGQRLVRRVRERRQCERDSHRRPGGARRQGPRARGHRG